jgi:hypothetical protein
MRDAKTTRQSASETDYIRLISRWLDGGPWEGVSRYYDAARGLRIKLEENGDALTQGGVAIITRNPTRLPDLSAGTRTSARLEARAVAAVSLRSRENCRLVWDGQQHVQRP